MNNQQREAATAAMTEWLAHPDELGQAPYKIECAGEFDLHDLHYYIFKYKKSKWSLEWLLGVCGGYETGELEHCGHIFSQMERYDAGSAEAKAIGMVEMIREYWMRQAEAAEAGKGEDGEAGRKGGPFVAFVLLNSEGWDREGFCADLAKEWDIVACTEAMDGDNKDSLVWDVDDMLATVGYMPAPVPNGEAEHNAASNYMWPEAVETAKTHVAHLMVAVLPRDGQLIDAGQLLVKLCSACLKQKNAIGVYVSGTVVEPGFYREAASVMQDGELPYLNWIYFGMVRTEKGFGAYTYGLEAFAKDELEVPDSSADPNELRGFLFNIAAYVISQDVTLRDGETLGSSDEEKIPLTRSPGQYLDGHTLKVGYKPN